MLRSGKVATVALSIVGEHWMEVQMLQLMRCMPPFDVYVTSLVGADLNHPDSMHAFAS